MNLNINKEILLEGFGVKGIPKTGSYNSSNKNNHKPLDSKGKALTEKEKEAGKRFAEKLKEATEKLENKEKDT